MTVLGKKMKSEKWTWWIMPITPALGRQEDILSLRPIWARNTSSKTLQHKSKKHLTHIVSPSVIKCEMLTLGTQLGKLPKMHILPCVQQEAGSSRTNCKDAELQWLKLKQRWLGAVPLSRGWVTGFWLKEVNQKNLEKRLSELTTTGKIGMWFPFLLAL